MNESDRETIDEMLDYISHLEIKNYRAFARVIARRLRNAPQIPQDNHFDGGDWVDGFVTGLEWVLDKLDGVEVV